MTAGRIALVTGANQGIGRALVSEIALRWTAGDLVLLTGRDPDRVSAAVSSISGVARVEGRVLDVSDAAAIASLAESLGAVDVMISNATMRLTPDRSQADQADEFLAVANGATHAVLRSFAPIMRPGGRLIIVASSLGALGNLGSQLHHLFEDASLAEVETVVAEWLAAIHAGMDQSLGWPAWLNVPSKVAQVAAVRAVARERRAEDLAADRLIAAVCPGLVDTATSRPWFTDFSRAKSPEQAARDLLDFILASPMKPEMYGELVRDGEVLDWHGHTPIPRTEAAAS
ncbi:SDR family NAD(P)-dependent oxidoreductase [Kutzneria buriramensis]|uniref:Short subunit dehydrogenase n=1 Tax=Kutzneria buriramensis TaxID=1045776 RepID=A0A3E0GXP3_9PSEU|nr:SDR family NAD(P)-dependent oxidoreductase [Kutzneria buriramensis]REH32622.1 short subunit dehydrogenase [Kutzneria buriramensis]